MTMPDMMREVSPWREWPGSVSPGPEGPHSSRFDRTAMARFGHGEELPIWFLVDESQDATDLESWRRLVESAERAAAYLRRHGIPADLDDRRALVWVAIGDREPHDRAGTVLNAWPDGRRYGIEWA
jgi:hypothetical protein